MTNFKPLLLVAVFGMFATACVSEPTATTDKPQSTADESHDQDLDPNAEVDSPDLTLGDVGTATYSTCYRGEVGEYKWIYAGCCYTTKLRQQLARCDGYHWIPQVGKYRCTTYACPI